MVDKTNILPQDALDVLHCERVESDDIMKSISRIVCLSKNVERSHSSSEIFELENN